jgi:prepilin signal peptidase PulO-like enzyme (type II secretory pathway)
MNYELVMIFYYWFIAFFLSAIFIYDLKYQEIPDSFTLVPAGILFSLGVIFSATGGSALGGQSFNLSIFPNVSSMLLGAIIAAGFFLLQFVASKGKWIGGGDIRLGVLMGVILGWKLTIIALFMAYVLGAIVGIILLILAKKKRDSQIAFGTFLSVATLVCMFWGNAILSWYLGFLV